MAPLSAPELHQLATNLQAILSTTRYGCTSLTQLTGGTTSFVFLGTLHQPLPATHHGGNQEQEDSVIIKHAAPFASCHTGFLVDAGRVKYEALMLEALHRFAPSNQAVAVKTPKLYHYDERERVLGIQYIPDTRSLHECLDRLSKEQAERMGHALGTWLSAFHAWMDTPEQSGLKAQLKQNKKEVELKWKLTWGQGTEVLDRLGDVVDEEDRRMWDAACLTAWEDLGKEEKKGLVHGDFWAGNILVANTLAAEGSTGELHLHIIDFEFSHFASRATDLGQFLGDLCERYYIHASPPFSILRVIVGFLTGHGPISEELKWRTAVYVGVHMVNWWSRGPPGRKDADESKRERGLGLVRTGVEFVKGGQEQDRRVFLDTPIAPLFEV
ncbi:uncharacterized protein N0V89_003604 [Didymosphaeria variabile]|uniref:Aminoglycoside phosphotransferase domain-containing protein n=1 Tax=Didymosphaeria variabile TaxID=1932322 RepID=A0A9W9CBN4_9PLEO|nr:uncharacterized protein N0V89_003604 [Didymosphaeria variabile]KAJ4355584.1 hypothetical protein N0V89_003604 [Didymosphaeria variabile]